MIEDSNYTHLVERLRDAIIVGDASAQADAFQDLDLAISDEPIFNSECFDVLLEAISNQSVGKASGSSHLIKIFEYNRDLLDEQQLQRLNESLYNVYAEYIDPAASILILELLVEGYSKEEALSMLKKLSSEVKSPALALIPYGLQYLCKRTRDSEISKHAKNIIKTIAKGQTEDFRREAEMAIVKIDQILAAK